MTLRRASGTVALLLSLATVACPAIAVAAGPAVVASNTASSASRDAKSFYEAALSAYREGRFGDAITAFAEADRLLPRAALSYNIAKAHERLNDVAGALRYFREYLRRAPSAENGAEVRHRIAELELLLGAKQLQQLSVLSEPPGAFVTVDGNQLGVTPWTGELEPGQHRLELRSADGVEQAFDIELLREHAMDIKLRLSPISGGPSAPARTAAARSDDDAKRSLTKGSEAAAIPSERAAPSGPSSTVLIAGSALTLVGLGVGIGFELRAQREHTSLDRYRVELGKSACAAAARPPECESVQAAADRFDRDRVLSIAGFATAAVATVGTVGYWLWAGSASANGGTRGIQHLAGLRVDGSVSSSGSSFALSGAF